MIKFRRSSGKRYVRVGLDRRLCFLSSIRLRRPKAAGAWSRFSKWGRLLLHPEWRSVRTKPVTFWNNREFDLDRDLYRRWERPRR